MVKNKEQNLQDPSSKAENHTIDNDDAGESAKIHNESRVDTGTSDLYDDGRFGPSND